MDSYKVIKTTKPDSSGFYEFVNHLPATVFNIVCEINDSDYSIDDDDGKGGRLEPLLLPFCTVVK